MTSSPTPSSALQIVDAHVHLYDSSVNVHPFLAKADPTFEALVGDYSALPKHYLLDAYLKDSRSCDVRGMVCHEFLSQDPVQEMRWMQLQAESSAVPQAIVALVDLLDPDLEATLEVYNALPAITAVRQHLGWDSSNRLRRFASRGDLLGDPAWRRGLAKLATYDFRCGLEVFAPQLPDLLPVIRRNSEIGFTIAVLGWPLDLTSSGFHAWRRDMRALSKCDNVCVSISAVECLFGMHWTPEQVRPWLLSAIESFGPARCMLGSHIPLSTLSYGFEHLFLAYREILASFSPDEQDQMFRSVAADWFRVRA